MACANVTVTIDSLVECEEDFTVKLMLDTIKDNLNLGNNSTHAILGDSDGEHSVQESCCKNVLL